MGVRDKSCLFLHGLNTLLWFSTVYNICWLLLEEWLEKERSWCTDYKEKAQFIQKIIPLFWSNTDSYLSILRRGGGKRIEMREVQKCVLEKGITIPERNFLSFVVSYPQASPVDIAVVSNFVTCPWAALSLPRGRVSRSHPGECASVTPSFGLGERCNGAEICPPFFFIFLSCLLFFFFFSTDLDLESHF